MNEEIIGILNDADEVMESVTCDPFGMNGIVLEGIKVNSLTSEQLQDPLVVKQLKKQIKSAKKWQTVLGVITKLNILLSGGMMVGGVKAAGTILTDPNNQQQTVNYDKTTNTIRVKTENTPEAIKNAKLALLVPIIQLAVSVLTSIVKKAIANKEIKDMTSLSVQINKSILLYEKQLKSNVSDREKQRLEIAISNLKELEQFMSKETNRLTK